MQDRKQRLFSKHRPYAGQTSEPTKIDWARLSKVPIGANRPALLFRVSRPRSVSLRGELSAARGMCFLHARPAGGRVGRLAQCFGLRDRRVAEA